MPRTRKKTKTRPVEDRKWSLYRGYSKEALDKLIDKDGGRGRSDYSYSQYYVPVAIDGLDI